MSIEIMTMFGLGASALLVAWGVVVRRAMERGGMLHGAGLMPAGAAQDVV